MQKQFWNNSTHRWNIKEGATRSGKTYLDYFIIPKRILEYKDRDGLKVLIGNTQMTIERNILEPMRQIYGTAHIGEVKQGSNTVTLFGEKFYALGADKASQVKRYQGSGIAYCYGDEVATWNEEVFQMIKSRLSYSYSKFDGTCNPDNPEHWFKKFLDSDADIYRQTYKIYDNPFLDKEFIKNLELEYSGTVYYDRFILGKWALAEGRVYSNYDPVRDPIDSIPEALTGRRVVSCDYGIENPCVFILWEEGVSGTWYASDGWFYDGRATKRPKTDSMYIEDLGKWLGSRTIKTIIVDPSASSFIASLREAHYKVVLAKNNVKPGILLTADLLNTGKIKILRRMTELLSEISGYCWDPKSVMLGDEKPIKVRDHWCDAMRYFVYTALRKSKHGAYAL